MNKSGFSNHGKHMAFALAIRLQWPKHYFHTHQWRCYTISKWNAIFICFENDLGVERLVNAESTMNEGLSITLRFRTYLKATILIILNDLPIKLLSIGFCDTLKAHPQKHKHIQYPCPIQIPILKQNIKLSLVYDRWEACCMCVLRSDRAG